MSVRIGEPAQADGRRREPWFVPPRLLTLGETGERHSTWLERGGGTD